MGSHLLKMDFYIAEKLVKKIKFDVSAIFDHKYLTLFRVCSGITLWSVGGHYGPDWF